MFQIGKVEYLASLKRGIRLPDSEEKTECTHT